MGGFFKILEKGTRIFVNKVKAEVVDTYAKRNSNNVLCPP